GSAPTTTIPTPRTSSRSGRRSTSGHSTRAWFESIPDERAAGSRQTDRRVSSSTVATPKEVLEIEGREVAVSNPDKVFFPKTGHTKIDLVRYYLAVAEGAIRGVGGRPMALK